MVKHLILIFSLLFISCASRKVNKTEQVTEQVIEQVNTIQIKDSSNVSIQYNIEKEIFTVQAKDTSKPFIYNNKTYSNVVLRHEKIKDNTLYSKQNKIAYKQENKYKEKTNTIVKEKKIDKKANYFVYLWLLLIPIGIIIYRYIKNKLLL